MIAYGYMLHTYYENRECLEEIPAILDLPDRPVYKHGSTVRKWYERADALKLGSKKLVGFPNVMQFKSEIAHFAHFMQANNITKYLEIGANSGALITWLHSYIGFRKVAAVSLDPIRALQNQNNTRGRKKIRSFIGSTRSQEYKKWRKSMGHFDMVFIDGDHTYEGCLKDYLFEKTQSHTFLAFHDVQNNKYTDVRRVWENNVTGYKVEFVNTDPNDPAKFADAELTEAGIGIVLPAPKRPRQELR